MNAAPAESMSAAPSASRAAAATPLVLVEGVSKRWDPGRPPVLVRIDLALEPGTLNAIVGRNGAGKTTLLRIIAGLIFPDSGSVRVEGLSPRDDRRSYQQRIGFLSAAQGSLYARLSVRRHLDFWAGVAFVPRASRGRVVEQALARFGLAELAERRVDRLSMGQRQRVRLAMAFLHEPRVVLLDEPRNSLDSEGAAILEEALARFTAAGGAAVWCSPTGEEIRAARDTVYLLEGGVVERW